MDMRQLNALVAVAEHGTFSAAADALDTVQSNVSAHVARLESELGAQLVDRAAGRLTEEGEAVVVRARRIQTELDAAAADVAALRDEVRGSVAMGMIGTTARWLVPPLLRMTAERHPAVKLVVREGTSTALEPALVRGDLDLAVVNLPVHVPDLADEPLFDEDLVLVVGRDDALAARKHVRLQDLARLPLLLPPPGTAFRDELDRATAPAGVALHPRAEVDGVRLIASITFEGEGPAILPATAVPLWLEDRFRLVPVQGLPRRRVGVVRRRRGLLAAPARAVAALLREVVASSAPGRAGLHAVG